MTEAASIMRSSKLVHWSGLASMLGGGLWMWGFPGLDEKVPPYSHAGGHLLLAAAGLLTLAGLVGLHVHDAGRSGRLGTTGVVFAVLGAGLVFVGNAAEGGFELDYGWGMFMLGMLTLVAGSVLVGIATLRAGVLPGWSALPLAIVPPMSLLAGLTASAMAAAGIFPEPAEDSPLMLLPIALDVLFGAIWVLMGYALWSAEGELGRGARRASPADSTTSDRRLGNNVAARG